MWVGESGVTQSEDLCDFSLEGGRRKGTGKVSISGKLGKRSLSRWPCSQLSQFFNNVMNFINCSCASEFLVEIGKKLSLVLKLIQGGQS